MTLCLLLFMSLSPQTLVEQLPQDDPDYEVDLGCLLFKEGEYEEACKKFMSSMQVLGYQPGRQASWTDHPPTSLFEHDRCDLIRSANILSGYLQKQACAVHDGWKLLQRMTHLF